MSKDKGVDIKGYHNEHLENVMTELRKIIQKNDVAVAAYIHTPGNVQFINHFFPSYSLLYYDEKAGGIRFKRIEDGTFKGSVEEYHVAVAETVNMIHGLIDMMAPIMKFLFDTADTLEKKYQVDFKPGDGRMHRS